ncbi:MAG: hypothetical protein C4332_03010 [Meiothermus sp.]
MLLLHGIGRSLEDWSATLEPLSKRYKVHAFDMVGFGRSDKPEVGYSSDYLRDFTLRFMDMLGLGKAVLIGNSSG